MKYFIKRILLFSTPIFIYTIIAIYIDPYNIIRKECSPKLMELKSQISCKLNYPLYKIQQYSDNPTDVILLGDSRTNKLNPQVFSSFRQISTTNLAYAGGTLSEIIDTFWYVSKKHNLKEVYIGANFNLYCESNNMNRVKEAIKLKEAPLSYLYSHYCFKSTFLILKSLLTGKIIEIEKPNNNKDEFWEYQLESSAYNFYRDYKYPSYYHKSLIEISDYCNESDIKLIFFIPPTHIDLQHKVNDFNLSEDDKRFKADLSKLSILYDFDYRNNLTVNRDNFSDPFHCNDSVAKIVIKEIATGDINFAQMHNNVF